MNISIKFITLLLIVFSSKLGIGQEKLKGIDLMFGEFKPYVLNNDGYNRYDIYLEIKKEDLFKVDSITINSDTLKIIEFKLFYAEHGFDVSTISYSSAFTQKMFNYIKRAEKGLWIYDIKVQSKSNIIYRLYSINIRYIK